MRDVIVQVFDVKWNIIKEDLVRYRGLGVTHLLVSPVQQHCVNINPWYRLYQPTGSTTPGNTLGNYHEFQSLIVRQ